MTPLELWLPAICEARFGRPKSYKDQAAPPPPPPLLPNPTTNDPFDSFPAGPPSCPSPFSPPPPFCVHLVSRSTEPSQPQSPALLAPRWFTTATLSILGVPFDPLFIPFSNTPSSLLFHQGHALDVVAFLPVHSLLSELPNKRTPRNHAFLVFPQDLARRRFGRSVRNGGGRKGRCWSWVYPRPPKTPRCVYTPSACERECGEARFLGLTSGRSCALCS